MGQDPRDHGGFASAFLSDHRVILSLLTSADLYSQPSASLPGVVLWMLQLLSMSSWKEEVPGVPVCHITWFRMMERACLRPGAGTGTGEGLGAADGFADVGFADVGFAYVGFAGVAFADETLADEALAEEALADVGLADERDGAEDFTFSFLVEDLAVWNVVGLLLADDATTFDELFDTDLQVVFDTNVKDVFDVNLDELFATGLVELRAAALEEVRDAGVDELFDGNAIPPCLVGEVGSVLVTLTEDLGIHVGFADELVAVVFVF